MKCVCDHCGKNFKTPFNIYPLGARHGVRKHILMRHLVMLQYPLPGSDLPPQIRLAKTFYAHGNGDEVEKNPADFS